MASDSRSFLGEVLPGPVNGPVQSLVPGSALGNPARTRDVSQPGHGYHPVRTCVPPLARKGYPLSEQGYLSPQPGGGLSCRFHF